MQQGVYNTFSSSSSTTSYSEFQSAVCSLDTGMSYDQYQTTAASNSGHSSANAWAVAASGFGFGAAVASANSNSELSSSEFEQSYYHNHQ
jgi:hypothetical protein